MSQIQTGFSLMCPKCGNRDCVLLDLQSLVDFSCLQCNGQYHRSDVEFLVRGWSKVLAWLDYAAPILDGRIKVEGVHDDAI